MTRHRIFGEDKPFCDWLRKQRELDSETGIVASDCDLVIHRYMTVCDRYGMNGTIATREVQALLQLECKTRNGKPSESQKDTLAKWHQFSGSKKRDHYTIRNFGVAFLSMSGTTPDDSDTLNWGRFIAGSDEYQIIWKRITKSVLVDLISFKIHPDNFTPNPFRRHHLTREIFCEETTEMGLHVPVKVFSRS